MTAGYLGCCTEPHKLSGLPNRNVLVHGSGHSEPRTKVAAEPGFPWPQWALCRALLAPPPPGSSVRGRSPLRVSPSCRPRSHRVRARPKTLLPDEVMFARRSQCQDVGSFWGTVFKPSP